MWTELLRYRVESDHRLVGISLYVEVPHAKAIRTFHPEGWMTVASAKTLRELGPRDERAEVIRREDFNRR